MLTPEGWRTLLRRMEAALTAPLHAPAEAFLREGRVAVSEIGRLVRNAIEEVDEAGGRYRVQFRADLRLALTTAFGAYKLELVSLLGRLTEELTRSVAKNMTSIRKYEAFVELETVHRRLEEQIERANGELRLLSYATKVLFKMSYPEWALG